MSTIQSLSLSYSQITQDPRNKPGHKSEPSDFDALLASLNASSSAGTKTSAAVDLSANLLSPVGGSHSLYGFIEDFLENMLASLSDSSGIASQGFGGTSPFTADFASTFGTSGPLPTFITLATAKLHLTPTQNKALQDIAVENKDIVKTPDSVQKIAMELQQAGIGYTTSLSA